MYPIDLPSFLPVFLVLKLYGLSTLDPQEWEDPPTAEDAHDDALDLALSVTQTPILGGGDDDGNGDRTMTRREMDDPLGLKRKLEIPRGADLRSLAPTLLSSKQFSPPAFLSQYHPEATFQDLQHGADNLRRNVEERGEEVRILVEREFGRFVAVKGSTDAAYRDMKTDLLAEGSDHGTREIRETIKGECIDCQALGDPLSSSPIERFEGAKAQVHLERFRKKQVSVRSTKKPSNEHQSCTKHPDNPFSPSDGTGPSASLLSPLGNGPSINNSNLTEAQIHARKEQQRRLLGKIWKEVEKVMAEMRTRLEDGLRGNISPDDGAVSTGAEDIWSGGQRMELSVEDVEKSIEILLELNPKEDPVWLYLDSQYRYIMSKMKTVYQKRLKQLEVIKANEAIKTMDESARALNLKRCIDQLMPEEVDPDFEISSSAGSQVWTAILELVRAVSTVLVQTVPEFWKICRGYKEGKYRKKNAAVSSDEIATGFLRCRKMTLDLIKLYISLIGQFFTLSDISVAASRKPVQSPSQSSNIDSATGNSGPTIPDFVPRNANSLVTCHYASKVLAEIVESTSEIDALTASSSSGTSLTSPTTSTDLGQETKKALREFVESCRWRLEEAICGTWSQDAKDFFRLEDWAINPSKIGTTVYVQKIGTLQKNNATVAWQVAGGSTEYGADKKIVPAVFVNKIKGCFLDSLYYFMDGLVRLALSGEEPLFSEHVLQQTHGIEWRDKDTRILVTMSNIHHLRTELLPNMLQRFEALYGLKSVDDKKVLANIIEQVDDVLFQDYLKRKREMFQSITAAGLLSPTADPLTNVRPKDVRPYMLKDLLYLVDAHAHVTNLAPALTQRVIETLVGELAHSLLQGFSQIQMMGIGAMLSATLEVEFLDRTVLPYVNQETMNVLNQIYASVSQAYTAYKASPQGSATEEDNLGGELEDLKRILMEARRATGVQFICFRQQKG
ncbi:hypothetical protein QFC24_000080 [Naganishia onofrii]|uniref:Uncharacterized protein n=1 Tax=Naganishia onofrii TaxID=1851511 RepID=A0ACC2XWY3_9TREE|nr:hypothetical protein QFC24_000080 [Naganishia onofrii]